MTSEARNGALAEDDAVLVTDDGQRPTEETVPEPADDVAAEPGTPKADEGPATRRRGRRPRGAAADEDAAETVQPAEEDDGRAPRSRAVIPLVPVLAVLLVLLLGATGWLWFTRPAPSSVRTADYVAVLEAARSEIVDLTSFDYLNLDADIAKVKRITTGDLQREAVDRLDKTRADVTNAQAVVNTDVVGAAVTRADDEHGTVVLFIQSTQKNNTVQQAQVVQFYVEATLTKVDGRWLLSGITGR